MTEKNAVLSNVNVILSSVLLAALVTGAVSWLINRDDVAVKYVDIAVHILTPEPKNGNQALREWAVKVINKYGACDLKIDGELKAKLISGEINFPVSGRISFTTDDVTVSVKGTVK